MEEYGSHGMMVMMKKQDRDRDRNRNRNRNRNGMSRRIVVAVDESEESMYALSWCLTNLLLLSDQQQEEEAEAEADNTSSTSTITLLLLYVKPTPPAYSSLDPAGYLNAGDVVATMEKYSRDSANSVMNRAEEVLHRGFNTTTTVMKVEKKIGSGDAKNVICAAVEKLGADVLIMGSHDYGFFKRALLGSVSDYCSKHVKCPLVVVKRPKN